MLALSRPITAVLVTANAFEARTVRDVLVRAGVRRVIEATDGAGALAAVSGEPLDLLVMDWDLPGTAIRDLVLKARSGNGPTPKVVVTMAGPTRKAVAAAQALTVDAIVASPFSPRCLADRLRPLVGVAGVLAPRVET